MPEELRRRLVEATERSGRSINAEIVTRLEASLEHERPDLVRASTTSKRGIAMMNRRTRRRLVAAGALALVLTAVAVGGLIQGGGVTAAPIVGLEFEESPPALAAAAKFAPPGGYKEGDRGTEDDFIQLATPGDSVPAQAIENALADWKKVKGRAFGGKSDWSPLGPTLGASLDNEFRDRSVYNAGTQNFSGRIAHVAIDPDCRENGQCTLWIANANGGVWRTNDALSDNPKWQFVSAGFEHQNTASIELDPNDKQARTLYVGTGEPNACGSGCEAGVGIYKSTNGGNTWVGPLGRDAFNHRAVGSIAVKPGNSNVIFAASGRAVRGVSNVCCGGVDALIPGAPHFGLYRSTNGGESWQLVHQGAPALCTESPDVVSGGATPCSARGARRVMFDPVDPNTVYVSFFARGIWRSRSNGDPGTWERIMDPVGLTFPVIVANNERAEFDVVALPGGATRMYVGVGGGVVDGSPNPGIQPVAAFARFRKNDNVGTPTAAAVAAAWTDLTSNVPDTPGYSSFGYCDPQCTYDNYVYVPPGADANTVYLSGDNEYSENNWGPNSPFCTAAFCPDDPSTGRSNGRGVLLTTNGGETFTDMTEDTSDQRYPVGAHPDHHALVTNPSNWRQFFDVGDGGVIRSNGVFVNDSGDCTDPKGYVGSRLAFCQLVLSRIPEKLTPLNEGLRTLHVYEMAVSPHDPDVVVFGTQDNGSWERQSGGTWVNTNVADGGHNNFDIGDPNFRQSAWQSGQLMTTYEPRNQLDMNWIASSLAFFTYAVEGVPFIGPAVNDPTRAGWLWTGREHVFRSTNYGRNPDLTVDEHRENCNVWYGDFDLDEDGVPGFPGGDPEDICDDWKPLGDPGVAGRLTNAAFGATRTGGTVAAVEPARDGETLWAATSTGRIFVLKDVDAADPATVTIDRIDDESTASPPRYPTAIYVDPDDPNHAWITYSGFTAKTPATPGHVFEVRYVPGASTFTAKDGTGDAAFGDIPATSLAVTNDGLIVVGTDFGAMSSTGDGRWAEAGKGLPTVPVADLVYVPSRDLVYAGTHGQGVWTLRLK